MVGTFYSAPEPVRNLTFRWLARLEGAVLCIIEAMKIMNEIASEFAGVVREIRVQDAQPVEYAKSSSGSTPMASPATTAPRPPRRPPRRTSS